MTNSPWNERGNVTWPIINFSPLRYSPAAEHHRPLAGTHFTIPRRVEGWVDLSIMMMMMTMGKRKSYYFSKSPITNHFAKFSLQDSKKSIRTSILQYFLWNLLCVLKTYSEKVLTQTLPWTIVCNITCITCNEQPLYVQLMEKSVFVFVAITICR